MSTTRLRLILLLYNALLPLGLLILLPASLLKMRKRGGYGGLFWQRFGFFERSVRERLAAVRGRCWWIHAVSVGEVNIARKLIDEILRQEPALRIVLSVTTTTGHAVALDHAPKAVDVIYSPLDLRSVTRSVLKRIRPQRLVLVEAEVWPNLVRLATRRGIPVCLVNARLSPRSERRYAKLRWITAPVFRMLDRVLVQEPDDATRWANLGVRTDRIQVTGSIKFDQAGAAGPPEEKRAAFRALLHARWGAPLPRFVLAASTHAGEEKALAELWAPLRAAHPDARLLLAPRHAERRAEVRAEVEATGLTAVLRSQPDEAVSGPPDVMILDSTGELAAWQSLASIVIIGKSFLATGGQNPVEAIAAKVPVLAGPHMENFAALMRLLLRADGIRQVESLPALAPALGEWLASPALAAELAVRGRKALDSHSGATLKTVRALQKFEQNIEKTVAPPGIDGTIAAQAF